MGLLARGARGSPGDVGNVSDRQKTGAPGTRLLALRLIAAASRRQGIVEGSGGAPRVFSIDLSPDRFSKGQP